MKINEDYSDIERQIKDLGQFLETCTDKNQYYSAASSFGILNYLYCLRYGNEFVSGEVADNITRKGMELYQEILSSIEEQVEKLIKKSNMRGGTDNISIAYLKKESGDL